MTIYRKVRKTLKPYLDSVGNLNFYHVPYRKKQKDVKVYPQTLRIQRKRIETVFNQYCDQHKIKRNLAKSYCGLEIRILNKVPAMILKHYWNFIHHKDAGKTKYALAA